jgi:hypothetical protein
MFAVFSPAAQSNIAADRRAILYFTGLFAILLAAHLRHSGVLWAEEDLPLAAALQMKRGAAIYRDIWFDKPPLVAGIYLLWQAAAGPVLRIAGAVYALIACLLGFGIAARLWSRREGYLAAGLLAFFLTFDTHSAVLPLAADLLLLTPHLAAIFFAVRGQSFASGVAAGIGFLFNTKAALVFMACALFVWPNALALAAGFALPNVFAILWLFTAGALPAYVEDVWRWPAQYAASPVVATPVANGIVRTLNWLGFHAALAIGCGVFWMRERRWKFMLWAAICYVGVILGWRFFPRYFFLLLPALTIGAARGLAMLGHRLRLAILIVSLAVPLVRFAPRYVSLSNWQDLALDEDSRAASRIVLAYARPASTLYVWGYRPEIYVYTKLKPATKFLECQAMTGVPADRHLTQSTVVLTEGAHQAREELAHSSPDIFVDGLSLYNPALSVRNYPELRTWFAQYREAARTRGTIVYLRSTMR